MNSRAVEYDVVEFERYKKLHKRIEDNKKSKSIIISTADFNMMQLYHEQMIELMNKLSVCRDTIAADLEKENMYNKNNNISKSLNSNEVNIIIKEYDENDKLREGFNMRIKLLNDINRVHLGMILSAVVLIILALLGLLLYSNNLFCMIHPLIYVVCLFMGIGWGVTALVSIRNTERGD